jgi:GntR family transcriptional repressor for pyruvate dehydrogenase complex
MSFSMDKQELGTGRKPMIDTISVPKASDILANRLREMILGGVFPEGEPLPAERELVTESGLSRSSVREALRVLEVEGLITTRPGRSGGSVVRLPGRGSVALSMHLFVRSHDIRLEALLDCRLAIEPFLAARAARERTASELAEMREIHTRFMTCNDDLALYKRLNLDWHLAIARASHNEILIALMEAIAQPVLEASGYRDVLTEEIRNDARKAHTAILESVEKKDPSSAFRRMQKHLGAYTEVARTALGES